MRALDSPMKFAMTQSLDCSFCSLAMGSGNGVASYATMLALCGAARYAVCPRCAANTESQAKSVWWQDKVEGEFRRLEAKHCKTCDRLKAYGTKCREHARG